MTEHPSENSVETPSGLYVDVREPDPADIKLRDIAWMLCLTNRFNGATGRDGHPVAMSVAEHAVFVSRRVEAKHGTNEQQLGGLHHDDPEFVLNDVVRPVKPLLGDVYRELTEEVAGAVIEALALPIEVADLEDPIIRQADRFAVFVEARDLMPSRAKGWMRHAAAWDMEGVPDRIVTPDYYRGGLTPEGAMNAFIERHNELMGRIHAQG